MSITSFYTDVLGSNLRNVRWSWGSHDPVTNRVFLRVWEHDLRRIDGVEAVLVLWEAPERRTPNYTERREHVRLIERGSTGYGVLCTAADPSAPGSRTIRSFDSSSLLRFGRILKQGDLQYAEVLSRVPVEELERPRTSATTLAEDLKTILAEKAEFTERGAIFSARIGQGRFRAEVLKLWGGRCAVTGAATLDAIRASHIKPWRLATDGERVDPYNGLPLAATLDALFDAGLITFDPEGALLTSRRLPVEERRLLGLEGARLATRPPSPTSPYLAFHSANVFRR